MLQPKNIYGWTGFELTSGDLTVGLTPSIGGRIMSLTYLGHELLYVDSNHAGETFNHLLWNDLAQTKKELGFRVWGGDKTWIAPQSSWLLGSPPLDLDAAPYSLSEEGDEVVMTSPICRETGLQVIRRIKLDKDKLHLTEELHNRSTKAVQKGIWNVTQVKRPCWFEIPTQPGAFRSYHHEDQTLPPFIDDLTPKEGKLKVDCSLGNLFKIGGMPSKGVLKIYLSIGDSAICWEKKFSYEPTAKYAHKSAVEVFNSSSYAYAEIEIHAPFKVLQPNEFAMLEQTWKISSCPSKI
jgi:hypothetical protein